MIGRPVNSRFLRTFHYQWNRMTIYRSSFRYLFDMLSSHSSNESRNRDWCGFFLVVKEERTFHILVQLNLTRMREPSSLLLSN